MDAASIFPHRFALGRSNILARPSDSNVVNFEISKVDVRAAADGQRQDHHPCSPDPSSILLFKLRP